MSRIRIAACTCVAAIVLAAGLEAQDRSAGPLEVPPPPTPDPAAAPADDLAPPRPDAPARLEAVPPRRSESPAPSDGFYRVSEILGMSVRSRDGRELGSIRDLVIDGGTQQVQYFILSGGRTVEASSDLFVMPWAVAEPQFEERRVIVEVPVERLQHAPVIPPQQLHGVEWTTRVDRFYDVPQRHRVLRPDFDRDRDDDHDDDDEFRIRQRPPFPPDVRIERKRDREDDDD